MDPIKASHEALRLDDFASIGVVHVQPAKWQALHDTPAFATSSTVGKNKPDEFARIGARLVQYARKNSHRPDSS